MTAAACACDLWPGGLEHYHLGYLAEDYEPSGLDEFHPDTTRNPVTAPA